MHVFFIRKCSTVRKAKKVHDFLDLRKLVNSYTFEIPIFTEAYHLFDLNLIYSLC